VPYAALARELNDSEIQLCEDHARDLEAAGLFEHAKAAGQAGAEARRKLRFRPSIPSLTKRLADAQLAAHTGNASRVEELANYIAPGALWWAFDWQSAAEQAKLCRHNFNPPEDIDEGWALARGSVLLIDEQQPGRAVVSPQLSRADLLFLGADPVLHSPTRFFISVEVKDEQVDAVLSNGWYAWERQKRLQSGLEEPVEVMVGGVPESFLSYVRFERAAKGLESGHRALLADIECKNILRSTYADGTFRLDFQRTRASKSDPCSRYYAPEEFDLVAACLHPRTERWEFRYALTADLDPHDKCEGRLSNRARLDSRWSDDPLNAIQRALVV
jgi:hypothetical protein